VTPPQASDQHSRARSRPFWSSWGLRLLILVGLWLYLPAEAFDRDDKTGFDKAVFLQFQCSDSPWSAHRSGPAPPHPQSSDGPSTWGALISSASAWAAAPLPSGLDGPPDHQVQLLRASCLCARSRLDESHRPWQEQQASILDATNRPSRGFIVRGEGGCFFDGMYASAVLPKAILR